jgi:hypothetical protein
MLGQELATQKLAAKVNDITLQALTSGVYFYTIFENGKIISTGKLINKN